MCSHVLCRITFPVVGLGISSDLSVDYSMLGFTSNYQVVPIELRVRVPEPTPGEAGVPPALQAQIDNARAKAQAKFGQSTDLTKSTDTSTSTPSSSKPEAYKSAMQSRPFEFPAYRPPPRPAVPNVIVGRTEATPADLRQLAGAVGHLVEYHRMVQTMPAILEERVYLLRMEQSRQIETYNNCRAMVEALLGRTGVPGKQHRTLGRLERIGQAQPLLLKRMDNLLQRLMDSYNGTLTDNEKKWFDELKRMRKDIFPTGDGSSLASKAAMVSTFTVA